MKFILLFIAGFLLSATPVFGTNGNRGLDADYSGVKPQIPKKTLLYACIRACYKIHDCGSGVDCTSYHTEYQKCKRGCYQRFEPGFNPVGETGPY